MSGRRLLDVLLMGALVVGTGILLAEAFAIRPPARLYPVAVLGVTLALCVTALVRGLRLARRGPAEAEAEAEADRDAIHVATIALAALALVLYAFAFSLHYLAATFVFLFGGYLYLSGRLTVRSAALSAVVAAVVTAFTYVLFALWLGVSLPA